MIKNAFLYIKNALEKVILVASMAFAMIILPRPACSQPSTDTLFLNSGGEYPINQHLYIYKTEKEVSPVFVYNSIADGQYIKLQTATFDDVRTTANYYWLLATLKNNQPYDETFYYQLNHPQLYSIKAYKKVDTGFSFIGKSGFAYPASQKMYHYYDNVFPLSLKAGQSVTLLLSIEIKNGHNSFFAPQLTDTNTFKAREQKFYLINGIITGIMVTAFLLNIFLGISLNEKLHFLYAVYIFFILYEIFLSQGLDSQYLYPGNETNTLNLMRYIVPCGCVTLMAWIMQWFLNQKRSNSRIKIFVDVINYTCIFSTAIYVLCYLLGLENKSVTGIYQTALACLAILQMLLVFASAVEKVIQGYKPAWFYIAAIACLFTGLIEYVLIYLGVNNITAIELRHPNDMQVGLVVETLIVFFGIVYRYNLYKKEKETLLTQVNMHQQKLINSIVGAQEEERKRIAEDLHDDVGATLSALAMHISNVPESFNNKDDIDRHYQHGLLLSNKAVGDIRTIAHNLLPKDFKSAGLFQVLEKKIQEMNAIGKINFALVTDGDDRRLAEVFAITVYRVINELLTNILKHSMASDASIQLLIEETGIQIMAEDDGIGFKQENIANKGIGLKNITGRIEFLKGYINMDSNEKGTTTIIHIPL